MPEVYPSESDLANARAASAKRERRVTGLIDERASLKANINLPGILKSTKTRYRKNVKRLTRRIKRIDRRVANPFKILYANVAAREAEARRRAANAFGVRATLGEGLAPRDDVNAGPAGPVVSRREALAAKRAVTAADQSPAGPRVTREAAMRAKQLAERADMNGPRVTRAAALRAKQLVERADMR